MANDSLATLLANVAEQLLVRGINITPVGDGWQITAAGPEQLAYPATILGHEEATTLGTALDGLEAILADTAASASSLADNSHAARTGRSW